MQMRARLPIPGIRRKTRLQEKECKGYAAPVVMDPGPAAYDLARRPDTPKLKRTQDNKHGCFISGIRHRLRAKDGKASLKRSGIRQCWRGRIFEEAGDKPGPRPGSSEGGYVELAARLCDAQWRPIQRQRDLTEYYDLIKEATAWST